MLPVKLRGGVARWIYIANSIASSIFLCGQVSTKVVMLLAPLSCTLGVKRCLCAWNIFKIKKSSEKKCNLDKHPRTSSTTEVTKVLKREVFVPLKSHLFQ